MSLSVCATIGEKYQKQCKCKPYFDDLLNINQCTLVERHDLQMVNKDLLKLIIIKPLSSTAEK